MAFIMRPCFGRNCLYAIGNIELIGIDVIQWSPDRFELVQENTTTTQATAKRKDDDVK